MIEKNTIIAGVAAAAGAAALILSIMAKRNINQSESLVKVNTGVAVASAQDLEAVDPWAEAADEGEEVEMNENGTHAGSFNVIMRDNVLMVSDSTLKLPGPSGAGIASDGTSVDDLYVFLAGENMVRYDSKSNYLMVNGKTIIRTISAVDASYDGICIFTNENGEKVLIGEKKVTDTAAIAVVHRTESTDGNVSEADRLTVMNILNGAEAGASVKSASLFGYDINPDWVETIVMTGNALEIAKGDSSVYIAPYTGNFAEGTTNSLTAGNLVLTYSDNIKDSATGYSPYILAFNNAQDGTTNSRMDSMRAKILAQNNMIIKDIFE